MRKFLESVNQFKYDYPMATLIGKRTNQKVALIFLKQASIKSVPQ